MQSRIPVVGCSSILYTSLLFAFGSFVFTDAADELALEEEEEDDDEAEEEEDEEEEAEEEEADETEDLFPDKRSLDSALLFLVNAEDEAEEEEPEAEEELRDDDEADDDE